MAVASQIFLSADGMATWSQLTINAQYSPRDCRSTNNEYYYLKPSYQPYTLWIAFNTRGTQQTNCLWIATLSTSSSTLTVQAGWMLGGNLCAVEGSSSSAYTVFCGASFITNLTSSINGTSIAPLAGATKKGYLDATLLDSLFYSPTSLVLYRSLLYVTDSQNCVIREIDPGRGSVSTVAGVQGVCRSVLFFCKGGTFWAVERKGGF
jgi:hypothetical protein